jgi:hypothetical protein
MRKWKLVFNLSRTKKSPDIFFKYSGFYFDINSFVDTKHQINSGAPAGFYSGLLISCWISNESLTVRGWL